ncbi:hypothetical protein AB833_06550 [Chromatiales bacterium (ex Bugula neritina AB1)]|nr:hypothetical protein AB833_06550 [Chromatiales bacterium (ex Bugula neritina AB1)]
MGIDIWELRQTQTVAALAQQPVTAATAAADAAPVPVHQNTFTTLSKSLAEYPLMLADSSVKSQKVEILVVIESPRLNDADHKLLTSMLAAIQLQSENYRLAQINLSGDAETARCEDIVARVQPVAILVMAKLPDSDVLQPLDVLRTGVHLTDWSRAPVVVTLHPRDLINNPSAKRPAWEDLKRFRIELDA